MVTRGRVTGLAGGGAVWAGGRRLVAVLAALSGRSYLTVGDAYPI